jgi:hypothetical protein
MLDKAYSTITLIVHSKLMKETLQSKIISGYHKDLGF